MPPDFCVKIYIDGTQRRIGSAVVIHRDWVLTAWHVTTALGRGQEPLVVAGAQQAVGIVDDTRVHSPSDGWLGPDLALMKLKTPITVSQVRWADAPAFDNVCGGSFVGFGPRTTHERSCRFDLARCMPRGAAGRYSYDPAINFVALQAPGFNYHNGDSGGPMLIASGDIHPELAGILSGGAYSTLGPEGPASNAPQLFSRGSFPWTKGVFTRTDQFKEWAETLTGERFP